ncbi:hypothetical protein Golax_010575 [Gossypium laxum]|uniref:Uncharacterized protein n=1 Tax=Gossypium laxum TaxID=34288 RepID=A0A7J8ZHP3_9ROSI|nr:hypothetical protein [Gossypium laxum]
MSVRKNSFIDFKTRSEKWIMSCAKL